MANGQFEGCVFGERARDIMDASISLIPENDG